MRERAAAPHCDELILHAPGECDVCDQYPDWQRLRRMWGVAFTGHEPIGNELGCPAERRRRYSILNLWPGNKAKLKETPAA